MVWCATLWWTNSKWPKSMYNPLVSSERIEWEQPPKWTEQSEWGKSCVNSRCFKIEKTFAKKRSELRGSEYFLHEQFPPEVVAKRRRLVSKLNQAKREGKTARISYDTLFLNGKPVKMDWDGPENGLHVLVWNCYGLSENKLADKDFIDLISCNDIIVISESWTDE